MAKIPQDSDKPVPAEWPPAPAVTAAIALSDWIRSNPDSDAGGVTSLRDRQAVVVYWKGEAPAELRRLAGEQLVPVTFESAAFSLDELMPVAKRLIADHRAIVESTGPAKDFSGVSVRLKDDAPAAAVEALVADAGMPVVFDRPHRRGDPPGGGVPAR